MSEAEKRELERLVCNLRNDGHGVVFGGILTFPGRAYQIMLSNIVDVNVTRGYAYCTGSDAVYFTRDRLVYCDYFGVCEEGEFAVLGYGWDEHHEHVNFSITARFPRSNRPLIYLVRSRGRPPVEASNHGEVLCILDDIFLGGLSQRRQREYDGVISSEDGMLQRRTNDIQLRGVSMTRLGGDACTELWRRIQALDELVMARGGSQGRQYHNNSVSPSDIV